MKTPNISAAQTDIGFANTYRIELIKQGLVFAVAIFAFTVSAFLLSERPMPAELGWRWCLYMGWASLLISTACGLVHLYCWEEFYISFRDFDFKAGKAEDHEKREALIQAGNKYRDILNCVRKLVRALQFFGLILGASLVALFAGKSFLPQ